MPRRDSLPAGGDLVALHPQAHQAALADLGWRPYTYNGTGHDTTGMGCMCDDKTCPGSSKPGRKPARA